MANKLLNVRMDQEMIEDLKKVCGELEISVTDAIKLFSNKLIKERTLPIEEKKEEENEVFEDDGSFYLKFMEEISETGVNEEKYIQLHTELSNILSFYCKEFGNLIDSTTFYQKDENTYIENYDIPFAEIEKTFKEKYEEELKNKILDKITVFYQEHYNQLVLLYKENKKMMEEERKKLENDKYINVMENLKNENPDLYRELLNKYSYNI